MSEENKTTRGAINDFVVNATKGKDKTHLELDKYKAMAELRDDFNTINIQNFALPTIGEMVQEDLMSDILQDFIEDENVKEKEKGILDESFYTETPFTTELGYHPQESVFMLKANALYEAPNCWTLNSMDGDTTYFKIDDIDDGGESFTFTNKVTYSSFKDYYKKMKGSSSLTIRHLGLNCPELPHFEIQAIPNNSKQWLIEKMTLKEVKQLAKTRTSVTYLKHPVNKDKTKLLERKDTDIVQLLKIIDDDGKTAYHEILTEEIAPGTTVEIENPNSAYQYLPIVVQDETEANTILDAYNCQKEIRSILGDAKEILLMINANGINFGKKAPLSQMTFNSLYYVGDTIDFLLKEWKNSFKNIQETNYSYKPYGTDTYGRSLGVVYVRQEKNNESRWININKYILAKSEHSVANPSYTSSPELQAIGAGVSDIFKTWSYNKDNFLYLDSFSNLTKDSYNEKLELHKTLTGVDFTKTRNCSLMIGDTFMLIPPESIRNVTQVFYEKLPNLRSKGTMTKQVGQNEQMLELTLYFYEDAGINGIKHEVTTPAGDKLTYYMNGLRSLLAQFKVTPYLPIENGYINDVLGIEAVSMENINIQTVEGFPRLLRVILTLREFNYRTFMPDLPVNDDNDEDNEATISELSPMFAKCFNWEIFRYYYQRSIMAGEKLNNMTFGSYDYNLQFYTHKNTLERFDFCSPPGMGSNISFYIPDETWLQNALQVKKERDTVLYSDTSYVDLSESAQDFLQQLSTLYERIQEAINPTPALDSTNLNDFRSQVSNIFKSTNEVVLKIPGLTKLNVEEDIVSEQECILNENINKDNGTTFLTIQPNEYNDKEIKKAEMLKYVHKVIDALLYEISDTKYTDGIKVNEAIFWNNNKKTYDFCWDFYLHLNTTNLTDNDMSNIKEVLVKNISQDEYNITIDKIFQNNQLRLRFKASFNSDMSKGEPEGVKSFYLTTQECELLSGSDGLDNDNTDTLLLDETDYDYVALQQIKFLVEEEKENYETESDISSNENNKAIDFYVKDYKNPANMPFVPFLENIPMAAISSNTSNTFTEIGLKAVEGVAPQFLGGQDTTLELQIITDDIVTVSMLNNLPIMASATAKKYRKILPAWPLKIRSEFTGLISVSEVLIDAIEVGTVEGYPGVYSIAMRLTSVDRTQRQREALRRLDLAPQGGNVNTQSSKLAINKFFAIESVLSQAELYPDLDLPTIEEMAKLGWKFVKYTGDNRIYPDPDFYITYNYPYTSLIIKKSLKDVISQQLLTTETDSNAHEFKFCDLMGMSVTAKIEEFVGLSVTDSNQKAQTYQAILDSHKQTVKEKLAQSNWDEDTQEDILQSLDEMMLLNYLTACDVTEGWEFKPGFKATLCDTSTNKAIREGSNVYASAIKEKRANAINLINKILDKPIKYKEKASDLEKLAPHSYQAAVENAVNHMFLDDEDGQALIKLLCPSLSLERLSGKYNTDSNNHLGYQTESTEYDKIFNEKYFNNVNPLKYIAGFVFAAGCALSGSEQYKGDSNEDLWYPNHYIEGYDITVKTHTQNAQNSFTPYMEYERVAGRTTFATELQQGITSGINFGAWRIKSYGLDEVSNIMLRDDRSIIYTDEYNDEIYRSGSNEGSPQCIEEGFLDPYYNLRTHNKDIMEKYKRSIAVSLESNAEAFIRVALTYLKKMILDGLIFSEIDVMVEDFSYFHNKYVKRTPLVIQATVGATVPTYTEAETELIALGMDKDQLAEFLTKLQKSFEKSFCARLIYPFMAAVTENDPKFYNVLKARDLTALTNLTGYVENSNYSGEASGKIFKFVAALSGCGMTLSNNNSNESTTSVSQQLINTMMKDIYIQAANDPRLYILHSFYDMLVNDKRGRLVRAFPTYYVIFVDEGRKIGSWKLHDNFYNMSSISEIQVVKSRKIAADTCTITMSNMFNSYTTESDISTTQQYLDVYGLKDVFYSIFTPELYFNKEKALRLRQQVPDKVQLQPGVRIHVRMGYSGDGSKLPIVFNGKIAEVEVGDVAQIVAQGDGHELMNPLNAFGEMEVNALDPAQSVCTWFKDIRGSLAKGGETPRDLLAKLLTAKYGGWKKVANDVFDGRWFNDNPFGITHFGDTKYNHIFGLGEPVQNLYEVSDSSLLKGSNEIWSEVTAKKSTPIINTSLQDKTLWDILHMCANSGLGYIGAVRDFGFRSTIFLGKPNHYYAYDYKLLDNKVVEKRKPFQQFHYYDSYNDIIYNAIKASEAQMKTNALGLWQASSAWWGREQATVGPIYLDMNIYPEYQKSMTVDTGLLADGNGGIDIPFATHYSEKWSLDPNDDKVNKALAWRMTANTLRDSVKDMYQGDVGIIGDPSVKPHDRVYIYDTYEDMQGMFEVESVVHSMSVQNGFTTSIMPDVIARHQDDMESSAQGLLASISTILIATVSSQIGNNLWMAAVNNKLAVTLAKSKVMYGTTMKLIEHSKNLSEATGMAEYLEKHPTAKRLFSNLNVIESKENLVLNHFVEAIDSLSKTKWSNNWADDYASFIKAFSQFTDLDVDEFGEAMLKAHKSDTFGLASSHTEESIEKAIKEVKKQRADLMKFFSADLDNIDIVKFAEDIKKYGITDEITNVATKEALDVLSQTTKLDSTKKAKYLSTLLSDEVIAAKVLDDKHVLKIDGLGNLYKSFKEMATDATNGLKAKNVIKALKGGDVIQDLLAVVMKLGRLNVASWLIDLAIGCTIDIFVGNTKELFTRWLQSVQAIDVYPLKKNGKPLIAGMNGHKGSVAMYPVKDGFNSIQGMILEVVEKINDMKIGKIQWGNFLLHNLAVDKDTLHDLCLDWRSDLGLTDPETEETGDDPNNNANKEDFYQNVYNTISSGYSNINHSAYTLMTKSRIKDHKATDRVTTDTYNHYEIKNVSVDSLVTNDNIRKLYFLERDDDLQKAISKDKLIISHNKARNAYMNIQFESGIERIPVVVNSKKTPVVIDAPLVQEDVMYLLKKLFVDHPLNGKVHFKSGVRINDESWRNTGFRFILEYQGSDKNLKEALGKLRNETSWKEISGGEEVTRYMFDYEEHEDVEEYDDGLLNFNAKYVIMVYPPTYNVYDETEQGEQDE